MRTSGGLRAQGSAEVDVIPEVHVFDTHAAVIDCTGRSLFLRALQAESGAADG